MLRQYGHHLGDTLSHRPTNGKKGDTPLQQVTHNLLLKPLSFLIPAPIPGIRIGNIRIAQEKEVVLLFGFLGEFRQDRPGTAMIILRKPLS